MGEHPHKQVLKELRPMLLVGSLEHPHRELRLLPLALVVGSLEHPHKQVLEELRPMLVGSLERALVVGSMVGSLEHPHKQGLEELCPMLVGSLEHPLLVVGSSDQQWLHWRAPRMCLLRTAGCRLDLSFTLTSSTCLPASVICFSRPRNLLPPCRKIRWWDTCWVSRAHQAYRTWASAATVAKFCPSSDLDSSLSPCTILTCARAASGHRRKFQARRGYVWSLLPIIFGTSCVWLASGGHCCQEAETETCQMQCFVQIPIK